MKLSDFNYHLPPELIAQEPQSPRDHSRLLVLEKKSGKISHKHFFDLPGYLRAGDLLILNNSKVFPARLLGQKAETGGKIEIFLLKKTLAEDKKEEWQCLIGGKGRKENLVIEFEKNLDALVLKKNLDGTWQIKFNKRGKQFLNTINKIGHVPLPPYIKRDRDQGQDKKNYQTIFADEKKIGSAAAPTAGLHFTPTLLKKIQKQGVKVKYVTLHVGLGTFAPVKTENIKEHKMHAEWVEIKKSVFTEVIKTKENKNRVIAVGTTSTRALETAFSSQGNNLRDKLKDFAGWTDIFIYPGYKFKAIDGLLTNFHLPKSTLLMLISALAGKKSIQKAYQEAIKEKYRFFSYGDAMLII